MLDFEFIFTLEVVCKCLAYLCSLTVRLQNKGGDISEVFRHVQTVMSSLHNVRDPANIEGHCTERATESFLRMGNGTFSPTQTISQSMRMSLFSADRQCFSKGALRRLYLAR